MKGVFIVTEISSEKIIVSAYREEDNSITSKLPVTHIQVSNPKKFNIEIGSKICIGFSKKVETIQGILALIIPVLFCGLGLYFSPYILSFFGFELSNELFQYGKFICASVFFLVAFGFVLKVSRGTYTIMVPNITELY